LKYSQYLADNITGAHLEIIENCGHMTMLEQPEAFNSAIERFLSTLSDVL
jgi:pimeloyl-ACP methyl ester carboxylesterase